MRARFPTPWGLFGALGVYAVLVMSYIAYAYWGSADYQASQEYLAAWRILGRDEGHHCTEPQLEDAYRHLLRAAQLQPYERSLHEDLESVAWRFDEHHWRVPSDLLLGADAQSALWAQRQRDEAPRYASGTHARGWDPESLLAGPGHAARWSLMGAGFIVIVWAYLRFSAKRVAAEKHEGNLRRLEREVKERAAQRRQ